MLYCNTATVAATWLADAGLGRSWAQAWALGRAGVGAGRAGGDTAMLACDTAEGPAATRPRLLRHCASARDHAWLGRGLGVGWAYWLGQLGQVGAPCTWLSSDSVFGPGSTQYYS